MDRIKGLVFDCDGVLFESRRANLAYYNTILKLLGEPTVSEDDNERANLCHTAASPQVFSGLLGQHRVDDALRIAETVDYRQFIPCMDPEPGLKESLSALARRYPLAIATNRGFSMPQILEHFELLKYFATVVTSRDVSRPKPFPDMLIEAAKRMQLSIDDLLFIGDSELDQAAARSAGMCFAVYRGELEADLAINHHHELVEFFIGQKPCTNGGRFE
ncbi:MAG: HAD family hydrolase [Deltaproteobacteria bacterium]|jgi:HAD superfamily hydrolase (TIGR01549 family)|nr:HAD family hydrolase [Deltaproteobacteria bacterium]